MKSFQLLSVIALLFLMAFPSLGQKRANKLNISLAARKNIADGKEDKYQVIYYKDGNSTFDIIITNISESDIVIPSPGFHAITLILTDSNGRKYTYPPPEGYGFSSCYSFVLVRLKPHESIIAKIAFGYMRYIPPEKENEVTIQLIFSPSMAAIQRTYPRLFPKSLLLSQEEKIVKFGPRKFMIKNFSDHLKSSEKKRPGKLLPKSEPPNRSKPIKQNVKKAIAGIVLGHVEFQEAGLDEAITILLALTEDKVKIINTLSDEQQNKIKPISFKADNTTLEKVLSLICGKAGLKYIIGRDAVYIGY